MGRPGANVLQMTKGDLLVKRAIPMLATLFLLFVCVGRTQADSLVGNFDLDQNLNPIPSVGQVTFTLNPNGTVAGSLVSYGNDILGFGFDSTRLISPSRTSRLRSSTLSAGRMRLVSTVWVLGRGE